MGGERRQRVTGTGRCAVASAISGSPPRTPADCLRTAGRTEPGRSRSTRMKPQVSGLPRGSPSGTRTPNPLIKSILATAQIVLPRHTRGTGVVTPLEAASAPTRRMWAGQRCVPPRSGVGNLWPVRSPGPGGHGEGLRPRRGEAAGAEPGAQLVDRMAVDGGTARGRSSGPRPARALPPPGVDRLRADTQMWRHVDHRPTGRHRIQHLAAKLRRIALPAHAPSLGPAWPEFQSPDPAEPGADQDGSQAA